MTDASKLLACAVRERGKSLLQGEAWLDGVSGEIERDIEKTLRT